MPIQACELNPARSLLDPDLSLRVGTVFHSPALEALRDGRKAEDADVDARENEFSPVQFSRWRRLPSDAGKTDAGVAAGAPRHESSAAVLSLAQTAATSVCAAEGGDPRFCYTVRFGTPPPCTHAARAPGINGAGRGWCEGGGSHIWHGRHRGKLVSLSYPNARAALERDARRPRRGPRAVRSHPGRQVSVST